jgi:phospholipase D
MQESVKITKTQTKSAIKNIGKLGGINSSVIGILILGFTFGVMFEEINGIGTWHSYHPATDKINICFTPPSGCGDLIALEIAKAKQTIYVQAYGFTSKPIIRELIRAKERGVKVAVILDSSNLHDKDSKMEELKSAGIPIGIDRMSGIAHNKVMIIDRKKVITGSFNFTNAADKNNTENVLLIEDPKIAQIYFKNWISRKNKLK